MNYEESSKVLCIESLHEQPTPIATVSIAIVDGLIYSYRVLKRFNIIQLTNNCLRV